MFSFFLTYAQNFAFFNLEFSSIFVVVVDDSHLLVRDESSIHAESYADLGSDYWQFGLRIIARILRSHGM